MKYSFKDKIGIVGSTNRQFPLIRSIKKQGFKRPKYHKNCCGIVEDITIDGTFFVQYRMRGFTKIIAYKSWPRHKKMEEWETLPF